MKKSFLAFLLFAVIFAGCLISEAFAADIWIWDFALQEVTPGGTMNLPTAVYNDEDSGRYYVIDGGNNRILSYDRNGKFLSSFNADNSLQKPFDLVREPGILWVVEKGRNSLTEIDLTNQKFTPHTISHNGSTVFPDRLAEHEGELYLLDKASGAILAMDKNMQEKKYYACSDCNQGFVDFKIKNNRMWALEQDSKSVYRFTLDGVQEKRIFLDASVLDFPRSLAVSENNLLYILDRHRGVVAVFDMDGQFLYDLFEPGESRGKLNYPIEIQFDQWGKLCVVEEGNGRVQVFRRK